MYDPAMYDPAMANIAFPAPAAFVLAGGKSTRMGADKAFVTLEGKTLLAWALESARSVTTEVSIVGDRAKFVEFAPVVEDVFRDCGPLGGIHAALRASQRELNLVLAVDLPFVSTALLKYLIKRARVSTSAIVTVARSAGGWQREFADAAEKALSDGRYKIDALFEAKRMQVISEAELQAAGFSPKMFRNLNTPQELKSGAMGR
jgi:molybdopterin-guanine dinucleotide biosynthesis protein A